MRCCGVSVGSLGGAERCSHRSRSLSPGRDPASPSVPTARDSVRRGQIPAASVNQRAVSLGPSLARRNSSRGRGLQLQRRLQLLLCFLPGDHCKGHVPVSVISQGPRTRCCPAPSGCGFQSVPRGLGGPGYNRPAGRLGSCNLLCIADNSL